MASPDKLTLLEKLDPIEPEKPVGNDEAQLRTMSMARSLRHIVGLRAENAFQLCRDVAIRLLGRVRGPETSSED